MNILFVMKHRGNAGNTHAVADYMRVAPQVRAQGRHLRRPACRGCRTCSFSDRTSARSTDRLSVRIRDLPPQARCRRRPCSASRPAAASADLRHGRDVQSRHPPRRLRLQPSTATPSAPAGSSYFDALADHVCKPTIAPPDEPARDRAAVLRLRSGARDRTRRRRPPKKYDILHVGHNWWRWRDVERNAAARRSSSIREQDRRDRLHRPVVGQAAARRPTPAIRCGVQVGSRRRSSGCASRRKTRSCTTDVIRTMSTAKINIFTQRPVLASPAAI